MLPQKRVLGESGTRQNIPPNPSSVKKRKTDIFSSSPAAPKFKKDGLSKLASSQPKSAFESEVLEKLTQDMSELKQNSAEKDQAWDRPPLENFDPETNDLAFQSIEIEEGTLHDKMVTLKMFGVTEAGNSVMLHVTKFKHYLYVPAPDGFAKTDCNSYRTFLETRLAQTEMAIHSVVPYMRQSIYGFQNNVESVYLKITATDPKFIPKIRSAIEGGAANWKGLWAGTEGGKIKTYDNLQYVLRFMVDCKVRSH